MNFLAWAFALGALAVAFPILFHLIRPTPKGAQSFSSLMFLKESPPRISKRSRIDNWLLLLMRGLIVVLLAAAFMRPFFRTGGEIFVNDLPGKRVAILVDRSSSMRRDGLWQAARKELDSILEELDPGDDIALIAFDDRVETLLGFSDESVVDTAVRSKQARTLFEGLEPGWNQTNLGAALISAADQVSAIDDKRRSELGMQIFVISDMQQGSDLGSLQTFVWPEDVRVDIRTLESTANGNAMVQVLPTDRTDSLKTGRRVRVSNSIDSREENFTVAWSDANGKVDEQSKTTFYVSPGTSQILRVPNPGSPSVDRIELTGDDSPFDNTCFSLTEMQQTVSIACFTNDRSDDPEKGLFFLSRAVPETSWRKVTVDRYDPREPKDWNDGLTPQLVVVTEKVSDSVAQRLSKFVNDGGVLLVTVNNRETLASINGLLPNVQEVSKPPTDRNGYAMLASIDFSYPLFAPMSGPSFNDFTGIRFWKHFSVTVDEDEQTQVVARFDNSLPAVWQHRIGEGRVIGLASSWAPENSQLARSTKFVPLITSALVMAGDSDRPEGSYLVGQQMELPKSESAWNVSQPDGNTTMIDGNIAKASFVFEQPGIFQFASGNNQFKVAVNLNPKESKTESMDADTLVSFDVKLGTQPTREEIAGGLQKLRDAQLESRQRVWKWILVTAICLIVIETLFASRKQPKPATNAGPEPAAT